MYGSGKVKASALEYHKQEECKERTAECRHCAAVVKVTRLEKHEADCGDRLAITI